MDPEHLEKLRRFSLTVALALITVLAAGLTLPPNERIPLFGVPLAISRPTLLPLGFAIASFLSAIRFYYYGHMIGISPHHRRRELLDQLYVNHESLRRRSRTLDGEVPFRGRDVSMWYGPAEFELFLGTRDYETAQKQSDLIVQAFPKCFTRRVSVKIMPKTGINDDDFSEHTEYDLLVSIPTWCRIATVIEALDYSSPVWLNVVALVWFVVANLMLHL
jgi:hypothetical protein